jgi:ketosteroid isomerase-like protein
MSGDLPPDIASLVGAEQRFCARARETSIRDAFFEALDDNSIVFHPGPVNGKEFYRGRPSNPGPILHWGPSYAEISNFGDLGWTTGPWEFTGPKDKKPSAYGHFATVWQFGIDHKWHALIDFGHSCPQAPAEEMRFAREGGDKTAERLMSLAEFTRSNSSLMSADSAYSQDLAHAGVGTALGHWADPDVRLYREDKAPLVGAEAAGKALANEWEHGVVAWGMAPGAIAKSGDLGFTYGTADLPFGKKGEPTRRNIMRIWRRAPGEDWRLALDVTIGQPPAAAAMAPAPPSTPEPKHP